MLIGYWTPSETLGGIGSAATGSLNVSPITVVVVVGALVVGLFWMLSRAKRDEDRVSRELVIAETRSADAIRERESLITAEWVTVPAKLHVSVSQTDPTTHRVSTSEVETEVVSGGELGVIGRGLALGPVVCHLDLGERWPVELRGVVVRLKELGPGEPSAATIRLDQATPAERERLVTWITHEETKQIARTKGGPVCEVCGRGMDADSEGARHRTCTKRESEVPQKPARLVLRGATELPKTGTDGG